MIALVCEELSVHFSTKVSPSHKRQDTSSNIICPEAGLPAGVTLIAFSAKHSWPSLAPPEIGQEVGASKPDYIQTTYTGPWVNILTLAVGLNGRKSLLADIKPQVL